MNSLFYGNKVSTDWAKRGNLCHASSQRYTSWMDIEQWIIRNLMTYQNCSVKASFYYEHENQFGYIFGKENLKVKHSDFKNSIVLEVSSLGVERAKAFILEEEIQG